MFISMQLDTLLSGKIVFVVHSNSPVKAATPALPSPSDRVGKNSCTECSFNYKVSFKKC